MMTARQDMQYNYITLCRDYSTIPAAFTSSQPAIRQLQKVIRHRFLSRHAPTILWRGLKNSIPSPGALALLHPLPQNTIRTPIDVPIRPRRVTCITPILLQLQNRRNVPTSITVIGCRPDGDNGIIEHLLKPLHDQLMRAAN